MGEVRVLVALVHNLHLYSQASGESWNCFKQVSDLGPICILERWLVVMRKPVLQRGQDWRQYQCGQQMYTEPPFSGWYSSGLWEHRARENQTVSSVRAYILLQ